METKNSIDSSDSLISRMNFPATSPAAAAAATSGQPSSFHRSLHSVRKPASPSKPWSSNNKKPNAPLPRNPTRVYKVDRMNFRELVQMLTGAATVSASAVPANSQPRCRLHEVAPPPLDLTTSTLQASSDLPEKEASTPLSAMFRELLSEDAKSSHLQLFDGSVETIGPAPLGLGQSHSSHGWCLVPVLSPGTLSSFESSTVL